MREARLRDRDSQGRYGQTPSQTVGPFFVIGLIKGGENVLVNEKTRGERIEIVGNVFDGDGLPVDDALLEIWQADADGIFRHPDDPNHARIDGNFRGFGRAATDESGAYRFSTVKPGRIDGAAPVINLRVFARGLLVHAVTRIYFADEPDNEQDTLFAGVDYGRRRTLLATPLKNTAVIAYRFDVRLQGEEETVFFDL